MTDAKGLATTYTYDALGRTVCEARPGFRGALLVSSNEYNTANQLIATRTYVLNENSILMPLAYTYFCYNTLGERNVTVFDMNLNHQIDWSDTDRIVSNDVRFVLLQGDWWRESSSWQARQNGSPELTLMGRSRTRLTGLGNGLVSETRSFDPLGNETITCSYRDRATHTTIQTTQSPDSTIVAETIARCGLTVSSRSTTGVTMTYAYDALGRQVAVTDPLGHTISTVYDAEDRVLAQRGATYPVDYAYDAYGNKVAMTTYRNEDDIPVGGVVPNAPHTGDTDRWLFGDLSDSIDSYSYNARSELTSARRTKNGQPISGFSEDFAYDPIGNRTSSATYDEAGEAQVSTYVANALNQYVSRTTPGFAAVRGEANPWRFSSEYEDTELGLDYYNYRHYEPVTGRWLQRDPVEIEAEPNLLSFMNNMNFGWDILGERYGNPVSGPSGFPEGPSSPYDSGGPYDPDGPNWWSKLPRCPCTILLKEDGCPLIAFDGEDWTAPKRTRHWGGTWEIRSIPQDKYGPGQQCVYDAKGNLIDDGPGAGTPDKVSPGGIGPTVCHILNDGWQYLISTSFDHLTHPPDCGCDANGRPCPINNGFANPPPKNLCCEK